MGEGNGKGAGNGRPAGRPSWSEPEIEHSGEYLEAYNEGYIAGMTKMEAEAEMKFDLGVRAGRVQVARELGDMTLVEPVEVRVTAKRNRRGKK